MTRYRKKPIEVDAIQWLGDNFDECVAFVAYEDEDQDLVQTPIRADSPDQLVFWCLKSSVDVVLDRYGWIIAEPDGEGFYPCTSEQFMATYEPADF